MKMKKLLFLGLSLWILSPTFAQMKQPTERLSLQKEMQQADKELQKIDKESIEQSIILIKKEYFKKNLILTDKEAENFWILFDKYLEKENQIHKDFRIALEKEGIKREKGEINKEGMDPELVIFYYDQKMIMKQALLKLEISFYEQIKEILTPENIATYFKLEKDFKKELATLREKQKNGPSGQPLKNNDLQKKSPAEMPQRSKG